MGEGAGPSWDDETEVAVVGGGPAGSVVAARLAQLGRRALVLEQARFPRFHIGESLLPASAPVLGALGLHDELDRRFLRKHGARFLDDALGPDHPGAAIRYVFAEAFPPATPHAWQVPRDEFDALLLRRAAELGAEVREGWRARRVLFDGEQAVGLEAEAPGGEVRRLRSHVVIDATGRDALLTGVSRGQRQDPSSNGGTQRGRSRVPGLDKTAFFTHVEGGHRHAGLDEGQIEITILEGRTEEGGIPGWAWFIPFRDGRSSVGFVLSSDTVRASLGDARALLGERTGPSPREHELPPSARAERLRAAFDDLVQRSPWMRRLLRDARPIGEVRAAADYSFRVAELAGDGWLAVGDAAGFIDPLFSTGAHLAIGGADRAATAIDEALRAGDVSAPRFASYARDLRRAQDLFLGAVQSFYRGELRALLFAQPQRPALRRTITSMLAGDVFHDEPTLPRWAAFVRERFAARP
ncbi:MAG: NAD(P)/FAD-dependent oxidoreductase [Byssovorax sp.]